MWQQAENHSEKVYGLLSAVRFPFIDEVSAGEALKAIKDARSLVWEKDGEVLGWIGLAYKGDGIWEIDIAVHPMQRGKWATRKSIKEVSKYIFTDLGAKAIIGVCFTADGMKLAHRLGFEMLPEGNKFMLTAEKAKERFM